MATGRVTLACFVEEMLRFLDLSSANNDTWQLNKTEDLDESGWYMVKKETKLLPVGPRPELLLNRRDGMEDDDADFMEDDPASVHVPSSNGIPCTFEYHILYSASYHVPVLYLNIYKSDGSLISLEELWQSVPTYFQDRLHHERWTFLTQQEHPLLRRPFYQLHPCHTADLMKQVPGEGAMKQRSYLLTWLSAVGPVVDLALPLGYAQVLQKKEEAIQT